MADLQAPESKSLPSSLIYARSDARPIVKARVAEIAASIRDIGLINPIVVRATKKYRNGSPADAWEILAGHHRFQACSVDLRMEKVPCVIREEDDLRAELVMIDENLCRADLTPAQEALQTSRRKELYEILHPETAAGVAGGLARHGLASDKMSFAADTADKTGRDRRTIERGVARGKALGDDLTRISGTSLDKGVELDALAKMPAEQREPLIRRASEGETISARETKPAPSETASPKRSTSDSDLSRYRDGRSLNTVPVEELKAMAEAAEVELRALRAEIARRADAGS